MAYSIIILSLIGIAISIYAYSTEIKLRKDKKFKALCDISDKISCSKAFMSDYSKLFGISNALMGIFFYLIIMFISFFLMRVVFYLAILSVIGSLYLAYISYIKLKTFCLVCTLVYIINILILIFSYINL